MSSPWKPRSCSKSAWKAPSANFTSVIPAKAGTQSPPTQGRPVRNDHRQRIRFTHPRGQRPPGIHRRSGNSARREPYGPTRRGARDHGPERLRQEHSRQHPGRPPGIHRHQWLRRVQGHGSAGHGAGRPGPRRRVSGLPVSGGTAGRARVAVPQSRGGRPACPLGRRGMGAREFDRLLRSKVAEVEIDPELVRRSVNEGFSGGEKKRNEVLQMASWSPPFRSWTRPTPGWTSTPCASWPTA